MKQKNKHITVIITLGVLVALIATSVFAAYVKNSSVLKNTFNPADSPTPTITEKFDRTLKKDVKFKIGNIEYPVYVRAKIVITWQDKYGNVYYSEPKKGLDYKIVLNDTDWEYNEADKFFYYNKVVESGGETKNLIETCEQTDKAPADGYTLSVEIIVQTIQAVGYTDNEKDEKPAWQDADWKGTDAWEVSE